MTERTGAIQGEASTKGVGDLPAHVLAAQLPLEAAWERVHEKAGMPGVDGVSVRRFAQTVPASLRALERQLASGEYRPLPLRMAELEKKHGGRRLLLVPAVRDRIAQTGSGCGSPGRCGMARTSRE